MKPALDYRPTSAPERLALLGLLAVPAALLYPTVHEVTGLAPVCPLRRLSSLRNDLQLIALDLLDYVSVDGELRRLVRGQDVQLLNQSERHRLRDANRPEGFLRHGSVACSAHEDARSKHFQRTRFRGCQL